MLLSPTERDALIQLARFLLNQGQSERALRVFSGLQVLSPDDPQLARAVAVAALEAGKFDRALTALDALALMGQIDGPFHLARATALSQSGRHEEAGIAMRAWMSARAALPVARLGEVGTADLSDARNAVQAVLHHAAGAVR